MADKYINQTGLVAIRDWANNKFTTNTAYATTTARVENVASSLSSLETEVESGVKTVKVNNTALTMDENRAVNVTVPTKVSDLTNDGDGTVGSEFATKSYVDTNGGKIDKIKVNGTEQAIASSDKSVDITVPTQTSQLTNNGTGAVGSSAYADNLITNQKLHEIKINGSGIPDNFEEELDNPFQKKFFDIYLQHNGVNVPVSTVRGVDGGTATLNIVTSTATSQLTNDSNFIVSSDVPVKGVAVNSSALTPDANGQVNVTVPTKVSDLTNDSNFIVSSDVPVKSVAVNNSTLTPDATGKVNVTVPTKVSDLTNDGDGTSGSAFATEDYVDTNGGKIDKIKVNNVEQTIAQADKSVNITVPTAVSDLSNDLNFQTDTQVATAISNAVSAAYKYKGSVATVEALPSSGQTIGDVYDVQETGMNYAWNGTAWDALGQLVDTSSLWAKSELTAMTTTEINAILNPTT